MPFLLRTPILGDERLYLSRVRLVIGVAKDSRKSAIARSMAFVTALFRG